MLSQAEGPSSSPGPSSPTVAAIGALRAQKGLQGCQSPLLTSCFPCPSSHLRQTRAPERTGLLALLCQQRERSRESPSLTLASKGTCCSTARCWA